MRTRPFLSHKREDRNSVIALKRVLAHYGVGGWRDLDDLHLGELSQPGFDNAIDNVTGGCLWYGTKRVLGSWYVNNVELPAVIARKRREPEYPLVPLFATVRPGETKNALQAAAKEADAKLTEDDVAVFMDANGHARGRGQRTHDFHGDVARRYVRSAVKWVGRGDYSVAITALTEPTGTQDLTFDWRRLIDPRTRVVVSGAEDVMLDALTTFRDATKPTAEFPKVTLDLDAPLPMAAVVGYEWRITSRLKLTIRQRTRSGIVVVEGDGPSDSGFPDWTETDRPGAGPVVIAVSTTPKPLTDPLAQYARYVGARRTLDLHVPAELDAAGIRGLARHVAGALRDVNSSGQPRHLLLAGPASLATFIGAGANGAGPVIIPVWNGSSYDSTMTLGG